MEALDSSFALAAEAEMDAGPGALTQWPTAPASRQRAPSSPPGAAAPPLCYSDLLRKLGSAGAGVDAPSCAAMFTRNELRFLLKRNGVSYHKPGKSNMMKTKLDMATDLVVRLAYEYACAVYLLVLTTLLPRRCWRQAASGRRIRWRTTR